MHTAPNFKSHCKNVMKDRQGFSLLEILGVLAIMAILVGIAAGPTLAMIERARQDAEARVLQRMATEIESSFQSSDLNGMNISALPGESEDPNWVTTFDAPGSATFPTTSYDGENYPVINSPGTNPWWFVKLARARGNPLPDIAAGNWSRGANGSLYDLLTNAYVRPRVLIAEPNTLNFTSQRYLLISLMAPLHRALPIPGPLGTDDLSIRTWFDSIWNNNFDQGNVPAGWDAEWNRNNNAQKLQIIRITQPRFQLTINNTSKTDGGFIYYNGRTPQNAPLTGSTLHGSNRNLYYVNAATPVLPLKVPAIDGVTGAWTEPGLLGGRRIIITRGATAAGAAAPNPVFDFNLNETTTITIQ